MTAPVAVVDLGSNSVRMVVYEKAGRAPLPRFNEKALCRLGEGLEEAGEISPPAFRRVVDTMGRFAAIAEAMGVARLDVLATEAVRRAANGEDLVQAIGAATGFEVRVLTGEEEARLAGLGVVAGFWRPTGMVGDMGGGSLELVEVTGRHVGTRHVSLSLGALPVKALLEAGDAKAARRRVDALLEASVPPLMTTEPTFYAVGGGWRALAKAHMAAVAAPVPVVHGYALATKEARKFAKRLWKLGPGELAALPGIAQRRADTSAAAALVLDRVLKRLAPDRVVFSALGLREGWLYDLMSDAQRRLDPLVEGARELGGMTARVPTFGAALVRWTDDLFPGETEVDRRLRVAACKLTDIAWRDHPDARPREAFRRILQFPFVGIEHAERVFLALALHARYGGAAKDPETAPAAALLAPSLRRRALILGRAQLLGHRVSASVPALLDTARLEVGNERLRLVVADASRIPDSEAVQGRLDLLAKAIGVAEAAIVIAPTAAATAAAARASAG